MTEKGKKAVILAHDAFGTLEGKTANCLVLYQRRFKIVAVIDREKAGRDAGDGDGSGGLGGGGAAGFQSWDAMVAFHTLKL